MSAFIVNRTHIDILVQAAFYADRCHGLSWYTQRVQGAAFRADRHEARCGANEDEVGQMLVSQNVHSVRCLYKEMDDAAALPGPNDEYWREPYRFTHHLAFRPAPSAVEVLKAVDCYEYQACDDPDWDRSEAAAFCDALRRLMIQLLPGYDAAPWTWYDEPSRTSTKGGA